MEKLQISIPDVLNLFWANLAFFWSYFHMLSDYREIWQMISCVMKVLYVSSMAEYLSINQSTNDTLCWQALHTE